MKRVLVALFVFLFSAGWMLPMGHAGDGTSGDYMAEIGTKFGRGLWNVISSPAEIPCTMTSDIKSQGAAAGTFTGLGKGLAFMCRRILAGVTEVGTFMIPMEATLPAVCTDPETA